MKVFAGGTREITRGIIQIGGQQRRITRGLANIGGLLKTIVSFVPPMSVSVPPFMYVSGSSNATIRIDTDVVTATVTGGKSPFTYSWALISGFGISISNPTLASTSFSAVVGPGDTRVGTVRVTATDSLGTSRTSDIGVTIQNFSIS